MTTIGPGNNHVPCVVVDDVARGVVTALERERAIGRAYNLSGRDLITQKQLLRTFATGRLMVPSPVSTPKELGLRSSLVMERLFELTGSQEEPPLTALHVAIFGSDAQIDSTRAREELGWEGKGDYEAAIRQSVEWFRSFG